MPTIRLVRPERNLADRVVRVRLKESIHFPDLSERRALKLAAVTHCVSRAHFGIWHKRFGRPDFEELSGIFTPLYFVDVESADVRLDPSQPLHVRGETFLAHTRDQTGEVDHIVRVGEHDVLAADARTQVARARLINVFTRYDPDPARRRVTALPPELGMGTLPSRVAELPELEDLVPSDRAPDFTDAEPRLWHYGQTDPNRHVSGMEYLRSAECYAAEALARCGHDLRRVYFTRARLLYRKPCFRGESYRRVAWLHGEAPPLITGAFLKEADALSGRPAVAVELTLAQHEDAG